MSDEGDVLKTTRIELPVSGGCTREATWLDKGEGLAAALARVMGTDAERAR